MRAFLIAGVICACALTQARAGEDGADRLVDTTREYQPVIADWRWTVPSVSLPPEVTLGKSNNNVALGVHEGRLYMGFRTSKNHFASKKTRMIVLSSGNGGMSWDFEHEFALGTDLREPHFVSLQGRLQFYFMVAGSNPLAFKPQGMWRSERRAAGDWSEPVKWSETEEIFWDVKVRDGVAWRTSYIGNHYGSGKSNIDVFFKKSRDGLAWENADPARPVVYHGGVSEVSYEWDPEGALWAVTRNEDGDDSGWGSQLAVDWRFPAKSDPNRYDSPKMFRHGRDLYLVARRDIDGPYDLGFRWLGFDIQKWLYLFTYSMRPKATTLYQIDRAGHRIVPLMDFPSAGDTAFPSILRTGPDRFLIANYSSDPEHPDYPWITGQLKKTAIYLLELVFKPAEGLR